MTDDLTLSFGGVDVSGWESIRVTRGIERCPGDFEVTLTERFPGETSTLVVVPGTSCEVRLGDDLVITGYIDRYMPQIADGTHSISVSGRGKCQDLVDCAAEWPGSQIAGKSALQVAEKLARPYGIKVRELDDTTVYFQTFNLILGETAWEIIERVCRKASVLCYEDTDGALLLGRVSKTRAANGFEEGVNVQRAMGAYTADQRYSEYVAFRFSFDNLFDIPGDDANLLLTVKDEDMVNLGRHRRRVLLSETGVGSEDVVRRRAHWDCNRRAGRSHQVKLVTDGWRDKAGRLYAPNTLAPVDIPSVKVTGVEWVISEVTYHRDSNGTTAEITLMPPEAFAVEPVLINPFWGDIATLGTQ